MRELYHRADETEWTSTEGKRDERVITHAISGGVVCRSDRCALRTESKPSNSTRSANRGLCSTCDYHRQPPDHNDNDLDDDDAHSGALLGVTRQ
jgi:hypothetical protein